MPRWNGEIMQRGKRTKVGGPEAMAAGPMLARKKGSWLEEMFWLLGEPEYSLAEDIPSESERGDRTAEEFYRAPAGVPEQKDFMLDALEGVQDQVTSAEFEVLQGEVWAGKLADEFALQSRIKSLQENRKTYSFRDWVADRNRMTNDEIMAEEIANQEAYAEEETGDNIFSEAFDGVNKDVYAASAN